MQPITFDFETLPIQGRPHYPPEPVSLSLQMPGWDAPKFFAWGHRTGGNNCSKEDAVRALREAYAQASAATPLLCHNAKFDIDVAEVHFGLPLPDWRAYHDTMFLLFLDDPHQRSLGLKPSAERLLGMAPEERDVVADWVLTHRPQLLGDFPEITGTHGGIKPSNAGAFVAYVDGAVVEAYANGDVERTRRLFDAIYPDIVERGMLDAYNRERRLLPILLRNEREGIRVDVHAIEKDREIFEKALGTVDDWLRGALKAPALDMDKDADVGAALADADMITEWTLTATGRRSVSKKTMKLSHFRDQSVAAAYSYRQKCATTLETFLRPWLGYAIDGRMHTTWNQVRQSKGAGSTGGTRTGRPSTDSPNFLNMPKAVKDSAMGGFLMPTHIEGLPGLPKIRGYIKPDEDGHVIGRRDFDQQELRVLAHFEDAGLLQAYLENPRLDVHQFVSDQIYEATGIDAGRSFAKTLNFGYVYGQGLGSLAEMLGRDTDEVRTVRNAQMQALPGLAELSGDIQRRARSGDSVRTWGGRQYFVEPPMTTKTGGRMTFEYKLLNYLIQGSSADITKEALIRYDEARKHGRLILSVYDEVDISVPEDKLREEMLLLRDVMLSVKLDVPLLSGAEWGRDLGNLEDLDEPAPDLSAWGCK